MEIAPPKILGYGHPHYSPSKTTGHLSRVPRVCEQTAKQDHFIPQHPRILQAPPRLMSRCALNTTPKTYHENKRGTSEVGFKKSWISIYQRYFLFWKRTYQARWVCCWKRFSMSFFFSQVAKAEPGMVSKAVASRNKGDRRFRDFQVGLAGGGGKTSMKIFREIFGMSWSPHVVKSMELRLWGMVRNTMFEKRVTTAMVLSSLMPFGRQEWGRYLCLDPNPNSNTWKIGFNNMPTSILYDIWQYIYHEAASSPRRITRAQTFFT